MALKWVIWFTPFTSSGSLSRSLQSCIIESGNMAILCLKIEVYGRSRDEDPHGDKTVAKPDVNPYKIVNQKFEDCCQLMIGTVRWNALVTMAVELTTGKVIVGPHNTFFKPHANSCFWLKKDAGKDMHNNLPRQTRTNFHNQVTYGNHAAIHPRFLGYNTRPVTLADLWSFKIEASGWSGVKLVAFVFHRLYGSTGTISKSEIQERLKLVIQSSKGAINDGTDSGSIHDNLACLVEVMEATVRRPVSVEVDKQLRGLADKVKTHITRTNHDVITEEVHKTIEGMILLP